MHKSPFNRLVLESCVFASLSLFLMSGITKSFSIKDKERPSENLALKTNRWIKTGGPSGGLGYDVRIHPLDKHIMFVTDNPSGINKSTDGGITWDARNQGISVRIGETDDGCPIFCLTIDPNNPDILWTGTQEAKGIFKSTNCGETWIEKDNGIVESDEISFRNFAIHPGHSDTVFTGTEIITGITGISFGKNKGKIYRTTDGGDHWESVWEGNSLVRFVLFDYLHPDTMYASTGIFDREAYDDTGLGLLKSTNGGNDWFQINNGLENMYLGFLDMHPQDPSILIAAAGTNFCREESGVYMTTNGGQDWDHILSTNYASTVCVFSPSNTQVLYAGSEVAFYRSDDGGENWTEFMKEGGGYGPEGIRAGIPISAAVDPDDPMTVFVNNYNGGNFISTDGGETWTNSSKGYTGASLSKVVISSENPATAYTIGRGGPFRSYNGGQDWEGIAFPPANSPEWFTMAIHPAEPQILLITTEGGGNIYKTTDGGNTWSLAYKHPDNGYEYTDGFSVLAYAPSNPDVVYGGTRVDKLTFENAAQARPSPGMFKSTDGGENWEEINTGLPVSLLSILSIAVHPRMDDIVYTGTWRDGIYKSTDGGQNWFSVNNGLGGTDVRTIAIDSVHPDTLFAGLSEGAGIYKSTDAGNLWEEINNGIELVCPHYLLPAGRIRLGKSVQAPPAVPHFGYSRIPWTSIQTILFDPKNSQTLYAGDLYSGVYRTRDGGQFWELMNDGLTFRTVQSLAISGNGEVMYAATAGGGIFRIVLEGNQTPQIQSTFPSAEDTVYMTIMDSMLFRIQAFDLDGDTLRYDWFINEQPIPTASTPNYLFHAEIYGLGSHGLSAQISDKDTTLDIAWNIHISSATDIQEDAERLNTFELSQNFPNPFNPITNIIYQLGKKIHVKIEIFNILGQRIQVLVDDIQDSGVYSIEWNGLVYGENKAISGIYFYRLTAGEYIQLRKMILLK